LTMLENAFLKLVEQCIFCIRTFSGGIGEI